MLTYIYKNNVFFKHALKLYICYYFVTFLLPNNINTVAERDKYFIRIAKHNL